MTAPDIALMRVMETLAGIRDDLDRRALSAAAAHIDIAMNMIAQADASPFIDI